MYKYEDIRNIHLEVSEVCNAACPMCSRFKMGGKSMNSDVTNAVMSLDLYKEIFTTSFIKQLEGITFCGVFGDPITAKDLVEQINYTVEHNPDIRIEISTNGGIRSTDWWTSLGKLMNTDRRRVAFGIDGLSDTNHIYRRNVQWDKLIDNIKAFVAAGGHAVWQFIKFKHNEHQQDEVRELAKELGFRNIMIKDTNRFGKDPYPVYNLGEEEPAYFLEPPSYFEWKQGTPKDLNEVEIECVVQERKEIYVNAKGEIYPCCYLYSNIHNFPQRYERFGGMLSTDQFKISTQGSVENILNSGAYQVIEESWNKPSIEEGKIQKCAEICGLKQRVKIEEKSI